jgi:uncharacterized cupin superfamily protein
MSVVPVAVPAFLDLRRYAARVPAPAAAPAATAWSANRGWLALPEGPVSLGCLTLPAGSGDVPAQAHDEFLIVLDGALDLTAGDQSLTLAKDASLVVPAGVALRWQSAAATTVIFMRCQADAGAAQALVPIDASAGLQPSGAPLAELLTTPTPQCRSFTDYRSLDGEFMCGTWDSTPYTRTSMRYRHYELMHLLEGEVAFVDGQDNEGVFGEGDIFLVTRGADCSWDSQVHVKKVFAIHRPA